jgi:biofilm PGA synthesis N-glycosyltransferase PgaC
MFKKLTIYICLYVLTIGIILSVFFLVPTDEIHLNLVRFIIIVFATVLLMKYFVYMVVSPWYDVMMAYDDYKQRKIHHRTAYEPKVSVLVPAWNEGPGLINTLKTLLNSTYRNLEVIVIDNASTDNTEEHVMALIKEHNKVELPDGQRLELVYVREGRQGKGYALNKGIDVSTGQILLSIDADCAVPPYSVQNFVNHFRNPKVMAAVGNVKIGNTQTLLGVVQYLEFLFSFYFKKSDSILGSIYIIGGAAGAFRREVFEKLGGYSVLNLTEDIELSFRIQMAGMKIVYAEDAVVYTEGATDLNGLISQRLRWKRGRFETFYHNSHLFFSTDKKHNKILSWLILPLAIFGDLQLFLELFFIVFVYIYSYLTKDYSSFISGIIVVSSMFAVQIMFDTHKRKWGRLLLLAPIGWLLFYATTFVEFNALIKSFWGYLRKEKGEWQVWKRKGVCVAIDAGTSENPGENEKDSDCA